MKFNSEDFRLKKSHTERLNNNAMDDSHYDIEEIQMYSSRNRGQPL